MKYYVSARPGPMPPPPELLDASISWLEGQLDNGTFECVFGFMEGGAFAIINASTHREVFDLMTEYPLFGMVTWDVHPLMEFKEGIDTLRAKLVEAQTALAAH